MHLFLRESPRALLLVTTQEEEACGLPSRVLLFRSSDKDTKQPTQAIVEFLHKFDVDLSGLIRLSNRAISGCLGLISVSNDLFLVVVTSSSSVGNIRPSAPSPEFVSRIHDVAFFSLNNASYDPVASFGDMDDPMNYDVDSMTGRDSPYYNQFSVQYPSTTQATAYEHPCQAMTKILSSGSFYYATHPHWDLSTRLEERLRREKGYGTVAGGNISISGAQHATNSASKDLATFDPRFVWNEYIVRSLLDFRERLDTRERDELDRCQFILLAIQGFVGLFSVPLPAPPSFGAPVIGTVALISRLGWKRAGTRFNTRGIDDDGNTANFVETETVFSTHDKSFSYVQVRGSVPLFWEQQGLQTFGHKIQITRPPQAALPAFERHFTQLLEEYRAVHAVNLLGKKDSESTLTYTYNAQMKLLEAGIENGDNASISQGRGSPASEMGGMNLGITNFDFHEAVKMGGHDSVIRDLRRLEGIRQGIGGFGFTTTDDYHGEDGGESHSELITEQEGVFRTNCLDCLDRTNFIQDILSRTVLEAFVLNIRRDWVNSASLWGYHRELWAENGDALSKIYAGTGALNTSFTRSGKRTLAGVLSDATKSVSRAYINNFQDKGKQTAIDMFLGNLSSQQQVTIFDPIHDSVRAGLDARRAEYSTKKPATIFVGTWNLNGRPPSTTESILPWLFPRPNGPEPDILVIGFQEIVPLNAQQIVQTDPRKKQEWESFITKQLDSRPGKVSDYFILRSEQLVGTALIVIVKAGLSGVIRNVEAATRKTGLRGMSGNKGAVAIRLDYHDTSFCFVTAHLAAGHLNVDERNSDYHTIVNGLHFSKGKTIGSHENVIWAADTNYRVPLDNEMVRSLAIMGDYDPLVAVDQLKSVMDRQIVFVGYQEGPLLFAPTYRYDLHSDQYDTSEKMRIPAWTDRILYKGNQLELAMYSRTELSSSDHKPVFGIFLAEIRIIDVAKRNALRRQLLESIIATSPGERLDDKLIKLSLSESSTGLPPPSSDDSAWWDGPEHPGGVFTPDVHTPIRITTNPFDSDVDSAEEKDYVDASLPEPILPQRPKPQAAAKKPPPPPPPTRKPAPDILPPHPAE